MSETNGFATIDSILKPCERRYLEVEHPEWGKYVLQSLDSLERGKIEKRAENGHTIDIKERFIVSMLVDPVSKARLLVDENIEQLQKKDAAFTDWLAMQCLKHARVNETDVEELVKN